MSGSPRPIRRPRDVRHGVVVPTQVDRTFTTVDESWRSARGRTASINPLSVSLRFAATAPRRFRSAVKSRKALGGTLPRKQRLPSCGAGVGVARTRPRAAARAGKTCCSYSCPLDAVAPRAAMLLDVTLPGGVPLLGQLPPTSRVPRICAAQCLEGRLGQAAVSGAGRPVHGGPARPGHTERDQLQGRVRLYRYFDTLESTRGDCVIPSSRRPRTYTETVSYTGGRAERGRAGDLLRAGGLAWTAECRALGTRLQQNYPSRFRGRRRRLRGGRRAGRVGAFGSRRSRTSHGSAGHVASGGSCSKNIVRPNENGKSGTQCSRVFTYCVSGSVNAARNDGKVLFRHR